MIKASLSSEMESLADFCEEMASLSSYNQPEAVTETWLEAAKYARSRIGPDQADALAALIDEAESRPGSSMYCKVTTYELRKALGQDVSEWPNGGRQ